MKNITIFLITIYQKTFSPLMSLLLGQKSICRYPITCSEFAKNAVAEKGVVTGLVMTVKRIASCSPLTKYEYI